MTDASLTVQVVALLAIAGFIALWLAPVETDAPLGVPVAGWTVCDLAFGEHIERPFTLEHEFDRISLGYDIVEALHIRTAFIDPDGQVVEGVVHQGVDGKDRIDLEVHRPEQGNWSWRLEAIEGPEGEGHLSQGDFIVLGFGLKGKVERTDATGGTLPSGSCPD
ncbi:MAG: hypothetical protein KY455_07215 [Euryarchaeota archaeon]|nr:hypothetical protein [Euryarchaeota archaeon]